MTQWFKNLRYIPIKSVLVTFFILCALPTGLMMVCITPPGQVPDESAHLARAEGLLHGALLAERRVVLSRLTGRPALKAEVQVDQGLYAVTFQGDTSRIDGRPVVTRQDFQALMALPADHRRILVNISNTGTYFPAAYVPATLGLALGRATHAPPYACLLLARLFMLATFLVLGALALILASFGEAALLTLLILPMTLFLAGSINQDGVLIAASCLSCAMLTRGTKGYRLLAMGMMVVFLGAKPPYVLLLGIFLLPLSGAGFLRRLRDVVIAGLPLLFWVGLISLFVVVPFSKAAYLPGPLYTGDGSVMMYATNAGANLHILLAQPSRLLSLPWHAAAQHGVSWLQQMIGVLGNLQIVLPDRYYLSWGFALLVAFSGVALGPRPAQPPAQIWADCLFTGLVVLSTCWLILISLYVCWTPVGLDHIEGLQGRYLLPILPVLLFAIPAWPSRLRLHPLLAAIPSMILGMVGLIYVPMKLLWAYYLY
ncbi:MAG: hypothetical protein B7X08_00470 [Acidocella sp. 20-63-7]|nr:MAG: hypothetical protein B7X08_00470 [Acidocella sp. 20-63-7]HQT46906.1 DUF2142 domain-containing protein [Acidocella sp.]